MGRRFPANDIHSLHPVLSFSLLAAAMAMIAGLCGVRARRRSRKSPTLSPPSPEKAKDSPVENRREVEPDQLPLPLPPTMKLRESYSCEDMNAMIASNNVASDRKKISTSLSLKVITRSLSMARNSHSVINREDHDQSNNCKRSSAMKSMDHQDSIWMKTIILGEKCKVPDRHDRHGRDGDRDEGDDHGVIYKGFNGVKITAYHPRTASSLSISRQCSFVDRDSNSKLDQHGSEVKNLELN